MSWGRIVLLAVLGLALLVTAICTWGSLGSAVCVYGLIMMGASLLYQRFLTHRGEDDFKDE